MTSEKLSLLNRINTLLTLAESFESGIHDTLQGNLASDIITPTDLNYTLTQIQNFLNKNYPNTKIIKNIRELYHDKNIQYSLYTDHILITVPIPIGNVEDKYTLYKIKSHQVSLHSKSNVTTKITNLPNYVALSKTGKYFLELTEEQLKTCTGKGALTCHKTISPIQNTAENCAVSIITQAKLVDSCKTNMIIPTKPPKYEIIPLTTNTFYIINGDLSKTWYLTCHKQTTIYTKNV